MNNDDILHNLFDVKGKVALVTGGGSGIGRIMAEALCYSGAVVIVASRKQAVLNIMVEEIMSSKPLGSVTGLVADLSNEESINNLIETIKNSYTKLDVLINNSGVSWGANMGNFPYFAWEKVLSVNVSGLFHLTQGLLPLLKVNASKHNPSRIINIGSVMGTAALGDGAYSYSASKAAVHQLTRILAKELATSFISVNALAPGPFSSKMTKFALNNKKKEAAVTSSIPLARIGERKDIAGAILYLCSNAGSYLTGAILPIDGGIHIATGPELFSGTEDF